MKELTNEAPPWDIKTINISLGGEEDENGFMNIEVFNDEHFHIAFRNANVCYSETNQNDFLVENMSLSVAKRLRDFLNYAIPIQKPVDNSVVDLKKSITVLCFSTRINNCLYAENIYTLDDLIKWTEIDLIKTPYLGKKALLEIKDKLSILGLGLKPLIFK
jgi:hypothetical protein